MSLIGIIVTFLGSVTVTLLCVHMIRTEKRLEKLEQLLPKRNSHPNAIRIENLLAHAWHARRDLDEAEAMIEILTGFLQEWRANPNYTPPGEE